MAPAYNRPRTRIRGKAAETPERCGDPARVRRPRRTRLEGPFPAESVHALDEAAFSGPDIAYWTAREEAELLSGGALKRLQEGQGEIKSIRTSSHTRGRGIATVLLTHILAEARRGGYHRLYLETGSQDFFAPAQLPAAGPTRLSCGRRTQARPGRCGRLRLPGDGPFLRTR